MNNNTLHQTNARFKFHFHRALPQISRQLKVSKKRWLNLRRAVWPTTTTRCPAPFACGAVRKSARFLLLLFFAAAQRKVSKRLDKAAEHYQTPIGHNRAYHKITTT
ncbi:hypothetical protein [Flavipsychrobacter stenotrophus]|uniref:hypothetical protein n=1 Tax=Flavipsychrobacter stenotrophus TaxID=2077091 RepID=UPI0010572AA8|nr:hypothetical protein [Flavipsychrobacter stenotrophus]